MTRLPVAVCALVLAALSCAACGPARPRAPIRAFVAASLVDATEELARAYAEHAGEGVGIEIHAASSSLLARQIESGARADLYVAASTEWGSRVEAEHGDPARPGRLLATNRLVVVAPAGSDRGALSKLADAPTGADVRWALADPAHVPAGVHARAALEAAGLYDEVSAGLVAAGDARMALAFVARGEVDLGIVYATDAASEPRVRVLLEVPAGLHPPIEYPVVVLRDARPETDAFVAWLDTDAARGILRARGFGSPPE